MAQAEPVCVAVSRVFGTQAAELPLVATASHARRRGYARIMLAAFDDVLAQVRSRFRPFDALRTVARSLQMVSKLEAGAVAAAGCCSVKWA